MVKCKARAFALRERSLADVSSAGPQVQRRAVWRRSLQACHVVAIVACAASLDRCRWSFSPDVAVVASWGKKV